MNANSTAAEVFAAYQLLGEAAFVALVVASNMSDARIREITAQVLNLPPMPAAQVARIRAKVAEKGRAYVKNSLLNAGQAEADIEVAFQAAGV